MRFVKNNYLLYIYDIFSYYGFGCYFLFHAFCTLESLAIKWKNVGKSGSIVKDVEESKIEDDNSLQ